MYTVKGKTQWDAPINYANEEAYKASQEADNISGRIGTLKVQIKKWNKQLTNKTYSEFKDEILNDIQKDEAEIEDLKEKLQNAIERFQTAGGIIE